MIKIEFFKDKNGYIYRYRMSGHSDYDEYGRDIVCSAISALAQTSLISFVSVINIQEEDMVYSISDDGFMDVELPRNIDGEKKDQSQIIMRTLEVGIRSIQEAYPENVTLKYREV